MPLGRTYVRRHILTAALVGATLVGTAAVADEKVSWDHDGTDTLVAGEPGSVTVSLSVRDADFPADLPLGYVHFILAYDPDDPSDSTPQTGLEVAWTRGDASGTAIVDGDGAIVVPGRPFERGSTPTLGTVAGDRQTLELALPEGDYVLFSDLVDMTSPTSRLAGGDRYATAATASSRVFPPAVETVYVASGEGFADALAAGPAAAHREAPLLLTARGRLPQATRDELRRLAPERIILVGGEVAVGSRVARELQPYAGQVIRIAGGDRYDTAARIARDAWGDQAVEAAYIANGEGFADALGASARAALDDVPVLLVTRDRVPATTATTLDVMGVRAITAAGGESAISRATLASLQDRVGTAVRRSGGDRYATSAALVGDDRTGGTLLVATGEAFPDGLTAASLARRLGADVLLTRPHTVPDVVMDRAASLAPRRVRGFGGTTALSRTTLRTFDHLRTPMTPLHREPVVEPGQGVTFTVEPS